MTRKIFAARLLAPAMALTIALTATPAMAQSAQAAQQEMMFRSNPIMLLIHLLLPAVQSAPPTKR